MKTEHFIKELCQAAGLILVSLLLVCAVFRLAEQLVRCCHKRYITIDSESVRA